MAGTIRIAILSDSGQAKKDVAGVAGSFKTSLAKVSAIGSAIGNTVANVVQSAVGGITDIVKEAASAADSLKKYQSTMKFAGFDQKQIDAATAAVKKYADDTVYELGDVANTSAQLAANGIKDFTGLTEAAGNLNAVAGGNADTFKSVSMMLTQTAGAGKLTTENWNQLADAIPGASGVMQEALRKNGAFVGDFRDAMAKGEITSDEFNAALMQLGSDPVAVEAATSTETFEGMLGNLQATIVSKLIPVLGAIQPHLQKFIGFITDKVIPGIETFASKAAPYVETFVGSLRDNLLPVVQAVGDYITGTVVPAFQDLVDWVKQNTDWLVPLVAAIGGAVLAYQAWQTAITVWQGVVKVGTGIQAAFNAVMAANPIMLVVMAVAALVAGLVYFFTQTETGQKVWQKFTAFLSDCVENIKTFFTKTIPDAFQKMMDKATAVKDWTVEKFTAMVDWLKGLPGRIVSAVGDLFATIREKAGAAKDWVVDKFLALVTWYTGLPGRIGSAIGDLFKSVKDKAGAAKDWVVDKFQSVIDWFRSAPGKISSAASGMWDGISSSFKGVINKVIGWWNNFSISLKVPSNALTDAIGLSGKGFTINTPNIPYLARGGITTGPTLAMIGDNPGGREAVIPLDKYDLGGGGLTRADLEYLAVLIVKGYEKGVEAIVDGFERGTTRHLDNYTRRQNLNRLQVYGTR